MSEGIPIRMLSELTGVAPTTLRAWERRYHLLSPERTSKGHRLYSQTDVALVKAVVASLQGGISISEAIRRQRQSDNSTANPPMPAHGDSQWPSFQRRMLSAVESFNEAKLDACYNEALSLYPFGLVSESLIGPVLESVGERWQKRPNGIAEEHFFSAYLRNKLGARLHHEASRKHGSLLLVACLPGEFHEIGVLLFAIEALGHGYRMLYLGPNSPLAQLTNVADRAGAEAIVLSGTSVKLDVIEQQWTALDLSKHSILVGGPFSTQHRDWLARNGALTLGCKPGIAVDTLVHSVPPYRRSTS